VKKKTTLPVAAERKGERKETFARAARSLNSLHLRPGKKKKKEKEKRLFTNTRRKGKSAAVDAPSNKKETLPPRARRKGNPEKKKSPRAVSDRKGKKKRGEKGSRSPSPLLSTPWPEFEKGIKKKPINYYSNPEGGKKRKGQKEKKRKAYVTSIL